jgi:hypothetical protein
MIYISVREAFTAAESLSWWFKDVIAFASSISSSNRSLSSFSKLFSDNSSIFFKASVQLQQSLSGSRSSRVTYKKWITLKFFETKPILTWIDKCLWILSAHGALSRSSKIGVILSVVFRQTLQRFSNFLTPSRLTVSKTFSAGAKYGSSPTTHTTPWSFTNLSISSGATARMWKKLAFQFKSNLFFTRLFAGYSSWFFSHGNCSCFTQAHLFSRYLWLL